MNNYQKEHAQALDLYFSGKFSEWAKLTNQLPTWVQIGIAGSIEYWKKRGRQQELEYKSINPNDVPIQEPE